MMVVLSCRARAVEMQLVWHLCLQRATEACKRVVHLQLGPWHVHLAQAAHRFCSLLLLVNLGQAADRNFQAAVRLR